MLVSSIWWPCLRSLQAVNLKSLRLHNRSWHRGTVKPTSTRDLVQSKASHRLLRRSLLTRTAHETHRVSWKSGGAPSAFTLAGLTAIGFGLATIKIPNVYCDSLSSIKSNPTYSPAPPPTPSASVPSPNPPTSSVNIYELSFGTVAGLCAGVFVKKGAKALAFALGGVFVLLQYLGSFSIVRVDWQRVSSRFEHMFYTTNADGTRRAPNVYSLWGWFVDFLTADFQPRASFIAGFALGLRLG